MRLQTGERWLDIREDGVDCVVEAEEAGVVKRVGDLGRGGGLYRQQQQSAIRALADVLPSPVAVAKDSS